VSLQSKIKDLWRWWQKIAKKIGDFQARLILTIFYIVIVLPLGLIVRLFGDPLGRKKSATGWEVKPETSVSLDSARRQF
jgi:hypothetical protein